MVEPQKSVAILEVCAQSLASAVAARDGGADRIELCAALDVGGLTPDFSLAGEVVQTVDIPVHAMIRPRAGDFTCSADEYEMMKDAVGNFRRIGCAGIVAGILTGERVPDVTRIAELVRLAGGMEVTFHRAIDQTGDLLTAASMVARTGVRRILTSGGAADAGAGAAVLARLVAMGGPVSVIAAGGITIDNAGALVRATGARELHSWSGVSGADGEVDARLVGSMKQAIQDTGPS